MAHFAQLNDNNIVTKVIVIDNSDTIDSDGNESEIVGAQFCTDLLGGTWVQTSYNGNIRVKYAGIGDTYNEELDAFISPVDFVSWTLNTSTKQYEPPVPYPNVILDDDGIPTTQYTWNEESLTWELTTPA